MNSTSCGQMARAWLARLRTMDSSAICFACGFRSVIAPLLRNAGRVVGQNQSLSNTLVYGIIRLQQFWARTHYLDTWKTDQARQSLIGGASRPRPNSMTDLPKL